jgi:hypothetical protein
MISIDVGDAVSAFANGGGFGNASWKLRRRGRGIAT